MRWILSLAILLAACGTANQPASDAPSGPLALQPLGFPEMDANKIAGPGCAFTPEGGGVGALFLARHDAGWMKLGGTVIRLPPSANSATLPATAWREYAAEAYAAALDVETDGPAVAMQMSGDPDTRDGNYLIYRSRLVVRDADGNVLYDQPGLADCDR